ncbi:MAG TPA: hypothetical protein VNA16_00630, partial [Abditibacteriaceae bacterium]|nr:hypothetical protein [Abditibacteriaceae bacterium]
MPVYLSTAVVGNDETLITLGYSGEIMGWFYPSKDHAQNIYQCLPAVYFGVPGHGQLHWTWGDEWRRHQEYCGDTNICRTIVISDSLGLQLSFTDLVPSGAPVLLRQFEVHNISPHRCLASTFLYGDWNMGGVRTGNALRYDGAEQVLLQSHRDVALAVGGDAVETWQTGKAGHEWDSNALHDLQDGALHQQNLEIGDVNWAFGFGVDLQPGATIERTAILAMGRCGDEALQTWRAARARSFGEHNEAREKTDTAWLSPGLETLQQSLRSTGLEATLSEELSAAYKRSLLCLPLLCGAEGVAVAAPEFDFEFLSCGGYGYFWPRDGGEYVNGLLDAGYPHFAQRMFDWCAQHQDASGLWHQRYFLNGEPGPNWCLPPDMLQIDQVGAVLWAYGKVQSSAAKMPDSEMHQAMVRQAADYLLSRLTARGVHGNAFDTWETFVGSFTYSNAAIYAAFKTAAAVLQDAKYEEAAARVKRGVLEHFVRGQDGYEYLVRGFTSHGDPDTIVDSASLGAIEPFGLLDLQDERDLRLAEGTLRAITERLEVDWEDGRAIRRFEGDAYVGGVPA